MQPSVSIYNTGTTQPSRGRWAACRRATATAASSPGLCLRRQEDREGADGIAEGITSPGPYWPREQARERHAPLRPRVSVSGPPGAARAAAIAPPTALRHRWVHPAAPSAATSSTASCNAAEDTSPLRAWLSRPWHGKWPPRVPPGRANRPGCSDGSPTPGSDAEPMGELSVCNRACATK
jgi:hypothetical protein